MYSSLLQNESSLQGKIKIFSRISDSEKNKVLRCWVQTFLRWHDLSVHEARSSSCLGPAGHMSYRHHILSLKNYLSDAFMSFRGFTGTKYFLFLPAARSTYLDQLCPSGWRSYKAFKTKGQKATLCQLSRSSGRDGEPVWSHSRARAWDTELGGHQDPTKLCPRGDVAPQEGGWGHARSERQWPRSSLTSAEQANSAMQNYFIRDGLYLVFCFI